jgi:hypothetical protein
MEQLTENVYECNLAVEAHMVCDLLSQAGISARVDGEFLQGAAGEIPLGNTVKVRVDPSRAAEAREVIGDWEKLQSPPESTGAPAARRPRFRSPLWFFIGMVVGGAGVVVLMRNPASANGVDYDGDGRYETTYHYAGTTLTTSTFDRNADGKPDARWKFDLRGFETAYESDDDFDGRFEWQGEAERGQPAHSVLDSDGDGRPEQAVYFRYGVPERIDYYFASGGRVVKREFLEGGLATHAEYDDDGDGRFERRVEYDAHGDPKL